MLFVKFAINNCFIELAESLYFNTGLDTLFEMILL